MQRYDIHICLKSELIEVQKFIDEYWLRNHALAKSKKLMNWQHYNKQKEVYNFVIAKHTSNNQIHGILGFIPMNQFDEMNPNNDLWLALWKVRDDVNAAGLGIHLLNYLMSFLKPRSICTVGINNMVIPFYEKFGYTVGKLNHYYMVNRSIKKFHLLGNFDDIYNHDYSNKQLNKLVRIKKSNFTKLSLKFGNLSSEKEIPFKTFNYFLNRYLCHPTYDYKVYAVIQQEELIGIIVLRIASYNSNHALRVVDYYGNSDGLVGIFQELQNLLNVYNAEYLDFYNIGIKEKKLYSGGFIKRDPTSQVIVPNYFEPFEKKNIEIGYAFKCDERYKYFLSVKEMEIKIVPIKLWHY